MKEHTNPCMLAASTDGVQTTETNSFEITTFETCSFETTFIWNFFIWDHSHLRPIHLRSYSFETAFIWDFFIWDRTVIWDHIHLRPHSFKITSIWDHIHFRSHSFYATFKVKLFWFTVNHIFMINLSLLCGRPEVLQGDYSFEVLQGYALPCPRWHQWRF